MRHPVSHADWTNQTVLDLRTKECMKSKLANTLHGAIRIVLILHAIAAGLVGIGTMIAIGGMMSSASGTGQGILGFIMPLLGACLPLAWIALSAIHWAAIMLLCEISGNIAAIAHSSAKKHE